MSSDFVLPPELYDVGWDRLPNTTDSGGLRFSQTPKLDEFVVKLHFMQGGSYPINTLFLSTKLTSIPGQTKEAPRPAPGSTSTYLKLKTTSFLLLVTILSMGTRRCRQIWSSKQLPTTSCQSNTKGRTSSSLLHTGTIRLTAMRRMTLVRSWFPRRKEARTVSAASALL